MERRLHEPLTLPKHPELLKEINEMSIGIKMYHSLQLDNLTDEQRTKFVQLHKKPEWDDMVELLRKCYNAINEQRENPRRY